MFIVNLYQQVSEQFSVFGSMRSRCRSKTCEGVLVASAYQLDTGCEIDVLDKALQFDDAKMQGKTTYDYSARRVPTADALPGAQLVPAALDGENKQLETRPTPTLLSILVVYLQILLANLPFLFLTETSKTLVFASCFRTR